MSTTDCRRDKQKRKIPWLSKVVREHVAPRTPPRHRLRKEKGKGEEDGDKEKEHGEEEEEEEEALRGVVEGRKASSREGRGGQGPGAEVLLVASGGRNGERWGRDGDGAGREEENVMELVFDPMLNCYYDASTGQYFSIQ